MNAATPAASVVVAGVRPGRSKRHAAVDAARVVEIEKRIAAGEDVSAATWSVLSSGALSYARFRAADAERPTDANLARLWARLLGRASPQIIEAAKTAASTRLASAATSAADRVVSLLDGDFGEARVRTRGEEEVVEVDSGAARVQMECARLVLESVGIGGRSGGVNVTTNVLTLGDGLRAMAEQRK
jgi:hypothetical protein